MKVLRNERGVALITALLLTLIALAIVMALLYVITWQTKLSGAHKRYKTAIAAAQGGGELFAKQVIPYVFANSSTTTNLLSAYLGMEVTDRSSTKCLKAKMNLPTGQWPAACGGGDRYDPTNKPDIKMILLGENSSNFNVYSKIVDTVPGNSDMSGFELLDSGAGVTGMSAGVAPKHMPALYRIEVLGQRAVNPLEKSKLSVLYAY